MPFRVDAGLLKASSCSDERSGDEGLHPLVSFSTTFFHGVANSSDRPLPFVKRGDFDVSRPYAVCLIQRSEGLLGNFSAVAH